MFPEKSYKEIPAIFHFVWIGEGIDKCIDNLKSWRRFHPHHTINLWVSLQSQKESEDLFLSLAKNENITLRNIDSNKVLINYEYIQQEIKNGNPWTASDMLRISILLKEPGYYFDIDIIPKETLPNCFHCKDGIFFYIDIEKTVERNCLNVSPAILVAAYSNHPALLQASKFIQYNFDYLREREKKFPEEIFYNRPITNSGINQKYRNDFFGELFMKGTPPNYIFARLVAGKALAGTANNYYITPSYLKETTRLDIDEIKEIRFPFLDSLHVPPATHETMTFTLDKKNLFARNLEVHAVLVNLYLSSKREIVNTSLVDRLQKFSGLKFFTRLDDFGFVDIFAKLGNRQQEKKANEIMKLDNREGILLGKSKFFLMVQLNKGDIADKVQNFLKQKGY